MAQRVKIIQSMKRREDQTSIASLERDINEFVSKLEGNVLKIEIIGDVSQMQNGVVFGIILFETKEKVKKEEK